MQRTKDFYKVAKDDLIFSMLTEHKSSKKDLLHQKNLVKIFTTKLSLALINANPQSDLTQSYWRTYHCIDDATVTDGKFKTHHYCKNRFCPVCARIRSAIIINGYEKQLSEVKDLSMLTLTVPNVSAIELKETITGITQSFRKIVNRYKSSRKQDKAFTIDGVRKIECTFNHELQNYHPHLHVLTSKAAAEHILIEWLKINPTAKRCAQDIKPADKNSIKEIAKYFSKIFSKDENGKLKIMPPKALDTINLAFRKVRTFQSFGNIKMVKDDFDENDLKDGIDCTCGDGEYEYAKEMFTWVCQQTGELAVDIPEHERKLNAEQIGEYLHDPETPTPEHYTNTDIVIEAITARKRKGNEYKTASKRQHNGQETAAQRTRNGSATDKERQRNG